MREWLIRLRGKRSQAEVAAECGVSQQFYSAIELGERRPSVDVAKKIAAALGFRWTLFFEDEDEDELTKTGTE